MSAEIRDYSSASSSLAPLNTMPYEEAPYEGPSKSKSFSLKSAHSKNVGLTERGVCMLLGGLLGTYALKKLYEKNWLKGALTLVGGGALVHRGGTGMCPIYESLGVNTAEGNEADQAKGFRVEKSIVIENSPAELFKFWRKFENLPQIMRHLSSVKVLSDGKSHWTAEAPAGMEVSWDAEVIGEQENHFISWRSLPSSQIQTEGTVSFDGLDADHSTRVTVSLNYYPPGGTLGIAVAKFFGRDANSEIEEDLETFKHYMESGAFPWDQGKSPTANTSLTSH
jgi:uncharacterized membrane protein